MKRLVYAMTLLVTEILGGTHLAQPASAFEIDTSSLEKFLPENGNSLKIKITFDEDVVKQVSFVLKSVSKHPGVAGNKTEPLDHEEDLLIAEGTDDLGPAPGRVTQVDPAVIVGKNPSLTATGDVDLINARGGAGGTIFRSKKELILVIASFDYGGSAKLVVTVNGVMKSVDIPEDLDGDRIPDVWEREATGSEDLSILGSADEPKDTDGDGLTDWEEYRGFFIQGKHYRLNTAPNDVPTAEKTPPVGGPLVKDAFVLDDEDVFTKHGRLLVQTKLAFHRVASSEVRKPTSKLSWTDGDSKFDFTPARQSAVVNFTTPLEHRLQQPQFALRLTTSLREEGVQGGKALVAWWNHPTPFVVGLDFMRKILGDEPAAKVTAVLEFLVAHEMSHRLTLNHPVRRVVVSRILTQSERRARKGTTIPVPAEGAFSPDLNEIRVKLTVEMLGQRAALLELPMVLKALEDVSLFAFVVLDGRLTGEVVAFLPPRRWFPSRLVENNIQAGDYNFRLFWRRHGLPEVTGGQRERMRALIKAGRLKLLVDVKHFVPSLLDARGSLVSPEVQHKLQAKDLGRISLTERRPDSVRGIDEELEVPESRRGEVK